MTVLVSLLLAGVGLASPPESTDGPTASEASPSCLIQAQALPLGGDDTALFVKGDAVNLRAGPSTGSEIQRELGIGTQVTAAACEKEETIGGKAGCWHPVQVDTGDGQAAGYLFSTALTDCRVAHDFDGDGAMEHLYAAVQGDGSLQVRLHDPNDPPRVVWHTVRTVDEDYVGTLRVVDAASAGQALAVVEDMEREECGTGATTSYLSYTPRVGFQLAIDAHYASDSGLSSEKRVLFSPDGRAQVTETTTDADHVHEYLIDVDLAVPGGTCGQTDHTCAPSMSAEACLKEAQVGCSDSDDCRAVAVRKARGSSGPDYKWFTDAECVASGAVVAACSRRFVEPRSPRIACCAAGATNRSREPW